MVLIICFWKSQITAHKIASSLSVLSQKHENCQFFKAFEITEIGGSLFFFKEWEPVVLLPIF